MNIRLIGLVFLLTGLAAWGQIDVPSDGSDGDLNPGAGTLTIDLSQAVPGQWDQAGTGAGVYDAAKWAVVFKYNLVNIPSGATVRFINHPSGAPVVWLVKETVSIAGTVDLSGGNAANLGSIAEPGPGGHRGGAAALFATVASGGFGPGGGLSASGTGNANAAGRFGDVRPYGNAQIVPLIGGSGGGGRTDATHDGSAGGGAILIACRNTVTVTGTVRSIAGTSSVYLGSGGAVRILANAIDGTSAGLIDTGSRGAVGRIRLEANSINGTVRRTPAASEAAPDSPPLIWPPDNAPSVKVVSIGGTSAPNDPRGSLNLGGQDVTLTGGGPVTVRVEARNVPRNWAVVVYAVPRHGQRFEVQAIRVSGDTPLSIWEAQLTLPPGAGVIQARAYRP